MTVEQDPERPAVARERLAGVENVELFVGDWRDVLPARAPFDFCSSTPAVSTRRPMRSALLAPGGLLLKDDLTPDAPTRPGA